MLPSGERTKKCCPRGQLSSTYFFVRFSLTDEKSTRSRESGLLTITLKRGGALLPAESAWILSNAATFSASDITAMFFVTVAMSATSSQHCRVLVACHGVTRTATATRSDVVHDAEQ